MQIMQMLGHVFELNRTTAERLVLEKSGHCEKDAQEKNITKSKCVQQMNDE